MKTAVHPKRAARGLQRGGTTVARGADGRLRVHVGETMHIVRLRRCFPWSEPGRFISLRDDDEREIVLIADPAELDDASRRVLEGALAEAGFVFEIMAVIDVEEEVELRRWSVACAQGRRTFQTRLDEWPRQLPDGGLLLRDLAGDLYRLPDQSTLDARSRTLLWAFVD